MAAEITVQQLLDAKGGELHFIAPDATVFETRKLLFGEIGWRRTD